MSESAPQNGSLESFGLFIDGQQVDAASGRTFESTNPYTGQPWAVLADGSPDDVDRAVASSRAAFSRVAERISKFSGRSVSGKTSPCSVTIRSQSGRGLIR